MDDKRFRLGFWDVVIQKETWAVIKVIAIILIVGILCTAGVFVVQQSRNKAVAKEREIETKVSQFIKDYSTVEVNEDTMSSLYEQGKQIGRESEKANQQEQKNNKHSK